MRKRFERFCLRHRDKGIPNLMLYICIGSGLVFLFTQLTQDPLLYNLLYFHPKLVLHGQIWRIFTFPLVMPQNNPLLMLLLLFCYYSIGRQIEMSWGTLRFNLYYLCGMLLMSIFCLIFGGYWDVDVYLGMSMHLNLSLFLAYSTMVPDAQFLFMFIIPVRAWVLGLVDIGFMIYDMVTMTMDGRFPFSLFPFVALLNYFLFFGSDVVNLLPPSWRYKLTRKKSRPAPRPKPGKPIPFPNQQQRSESRPIKNYTHRCTVCGRTDVSDPDLEFRYCSRCNGYYCYCSDHISNHTHVE